MRLSAGVGGRTDPPSGSLPPDGRPGDAEYGLDLGGEVEGTGGTRPNTADTRMSITTRDRPNAAGHAERSNR